LPFAQQIGGLVGDNDNFQFLVAIIAVGLALAGLLILTVVAVLATWRQHSDTRSTHRATIEALSRIEEIVRSWTPGGPAPLLARPPLPPLEGVPNESEALRSLLPLLSELDESFRQMSEARTAYSGQVAASLASSEAALRALEESTERIIQGLREFMEQVRAGNGENYNRTPP
jgi:LmbE family N-acetylglucosaminyl deacetylase